MKTKWPCIKKLSTASKRFTKRSKQGKLSQKIQISLFSQEMLKMSPSKESIQSNEPQFHEKRLDLILEKIAVSHFGKDFPNSISNKENKENME
jgi:hypothetical protein